MENFDGDASNQVIWFTDVVDGSRYDQTPEALAVMDEWMLNLLKRPERRVAAAKPELATDRCFDASGVEIARGDAVWSGILDDGAPGACTEAFPVYSSPRIVAGGPIEGGVFKCALQSVDDAIARGLYGSWEPNAVERATLGAIFPTGVCDYTQPDQGLPPGW